MGLIAFAVAMAFAGCGDEPIVLTPADGGASEQRDASIRDSSASRGFRDGETGTTPPDEGGIVGDEAMPGCVAGRRNETSPLSDEEVAMSLAAETCPSRMIRCVNDVAYECTGRGFPESDGVWKVSASVECPLIADDACADLQREGDRLLEQFDLSCSTHDDCQVDTDWESCDCELSASALLHSIHSRIGTYLANEEQRVRGGCDFPDFCNGEYEGFHYSCDEAPPQPYCDHGTCQVWWGSCFDDFGAFLDEIDGIVRDSGPPEAGTADAADAG